MSFKYMFELNGIELQDVSIGATTLEKLEEPLDEGSIRLPFTIRNYEYEMLGYLKITIVDEDLESISLEFLVISDEVSEGSKYGDFIHEVTLIEYTHKYDKYLVHSLAYTKSIKDDNPAKFTVNNQINYKYDTGIFVMRVWIPPIEVKSTYYSDELITFPQVSEGVQATTIHSGTYHNFNDNINVYIKINSTRWTLSSTNAVYNLSPGDYEIEYGFVGVSNGIGIPSGSDVWLYKYQIRVIDRERISVLDILNLIRDNISTFGGIESKLYFDNTRLFNIDSSLESFLSSVEIPQVYIQKATLRQVLNSVFLYVNSISRAYKDTEEDILSMDQFNKIVGDFTPSDISGFHTSQESNDLASKGVSWLERVLPDNRERANIIQPGSDQYQTVRSNNIQIVQDKFGLELAKTLYEPKHFTTIMRRIDVGEVSGVSNPVKISLEYYDINLTPRFINKTEWSIKEQTTNFPATETQGIFDEEVGLRKNKVANIYWEQGTIYIEFSEIFGFVFQEALIQNVIEEAINEQLTRNPIYPLYREISGTNYMITRYQILYGKYIDDVFQQMMISFSNIDWRYQKYNIEYITQENTTTEVEREDLSYLKYYSEARQNQSDKLINVELASRKSYGELQRSGVPNKTFQKYHTDLSSLYTVGMQDSNGFVITKRKLELHNNYILATYNATKDFNKLSLYIGLKQAYRAFEIPQTSQIFERTETYRDYIYLVRPGALLSDELTKIYGDTTLELAFGNLINDWKDMETSGKTRVTSAYVRTDKFLEEYVDGTYRYGISTPVNAYGKKGGLVFQFGFMNNQIALSSVDTINGNRYNKAIRYTDTLGNMNELWFEMSRVYELTEANTDWTDIETHDNYPLVRTKLSSFSQENNLIFQSGGMLLADTSYDPLIITKDKSQNITVPYQLNILSYEYELYILGQEFFNQNLLVKNPIEENNTIIGEKKYLYIYNTFTKYGIFDDLKIKSGYSQSIELISGFNVEIDLDTNYRQLQFLGSTLTAIQNNSNWAIGDGSGNLYLACNENINGFGFSTTHFRAELSEIGNREKHSIPILQRFYVTIENGCIIENNLDFTSQQGINISEQFIHITSFELGDDIAIEMSEQYILQDNLDSIHHIGVYINEQFIYTDLLQLGDDIAIELEETYIIQDNLDFISHVGLNINEQFIHIETLDYETALTYATSWIATTNTSYNQSVNLSTGDLNCRTESDGAIWLTTNYPPSNYLGGYIMRVRVITTEALCEVYYYRAT